MPVHGWAVVLLDTPEAFADAGPAREDETEGRVEVTSSAEIDGVRWAYSERGSGPLMLFFHGTFSGKTLFASQIDSLCKDYRCVAVDWPGHGESGFNTNGWTVQDLVRGVPALIRSLGCESAVLIGVSQGGAVSMRVALENPAIVRALVTISAGPDGPAPTMVEKVEQLGVTLRDADDSTRESALTALQLSAFHAPGWGDTSPVAAEDELRMMLGHDRQAMALAARIPGTYASIEDQLCDIGCPTLVIWGSEDARAFWGPKMVDLIPNSRLEEIEGAGHHVPLDAPEETLAALRTFMGDLDIIG